jgi:hypothetical protein
MVPPIGALKFIDRMKEKTVSEWQTIDTAPKDGSTVLAYSPVDGPFTSRWEGSLWQGQPWRPYKEALKASPTHWMPLPESPKGGGQ